MDTRGQGAKGSSEKKYIYRITGRFRRVEHTARRDG